MRPPAARALALLSVLASLLLSACAMLPRTVDISQAQLQSALARRFPVQDRNLELLDLEASAPRLQLQPESNRLRVDLSLSALQRLLRRPLKGQMALSFTPRWEASDQSLRMREVRVEQFELQGLPAQVREPMERLGPMLAQRVLDGAVLHRFSAEDLRRAGGWTPGEIRVTPDGLRISFQPPK